MNLHAQLVDVIARLEDILASAHDPDCPDPRWVFWKEREPVEHAADRADQLRMDALDILDTLGRAKQVSRLENVRFSSSVTVRDNSTHFATTVKIADRDAIQIGLRILTRVASRMGIASPLAPNLQPKRRRGAPPARDHATVAQILRSTPGWRDHFSEVVKHLDENHIKISTEWDKKIPKSVARPLTWTRIHANRLIDKRTMIKVLERSLKVAATAEQLRPV